MRDLGFDYYWFDNHCENQFAKGFGAALQSRLKTSNHLLLNQISIN